MSINLNNRPDFRRSDSPYSIAMRPLLQLIYVMVLRVERAELRQTTKGYRKSFLPDNCRFRSSLEPVLILITYNSFTLVLYPELRMAAAAAQRTI